MKPFSKIAYFYKTVPKKHKRIFHNIFFYNNPNCVDYFVRNDAIIASFNSAYSASKVLETRNRFDHKIILVVDQAYKKHYKNCLIIYRELTEQIRNIIDLGIGTILHENEDFTVVQFGTFYITATIQNILQKHKVRVEFAKRKLVKQIVELEGY